MLSIRTSFSFFIGLSIIPLLWGTSFTVFAQSEIEKLQTEIRDRGNRLAEIEREIAQFESALKEVGAEKKTLQNAINQLELERKKCKQIFRILNKKLTQLTLKSAN